MRLKKEYYIEIKNAKKGSKNPTVTSKSKERKLKRRQLKNAISESSSPAILSKASSGNCNDDNKSNKTHLQILFFKVIICSPSSRICCRSLESEVIKMSWSKFSDNSRN
ncbi:hypothetical protein BpHYR1_013601 [Brachionus plicatilis]|uniref:Uncharacterized protein n=1 Tax=Brachionus plicatilis TaxID=10195 RepID=A0A3M7T4D3_BRAPC|nr:hypothetical protein BpHYR1_013601 [Brachionus plicatilis]